MDSETVINTLKSILSRQTGMFIHHLVKEYRESKGTKIPYEALGYNSFLELLRSSDQFNVAMTNRNAFFVTVKPSASSKHVNDSDKNSKPQSQQRMPLELIDENQAIEKPFRIQQKAPTNAFQGNEKTELNNHSIAVRDDNNENHDENKINMTKTSKQHHDNDSLKHFKKVFELYGRESKLISRKDPLTSVGSSNQAIIDMLNGPFDSQRWALNRRCPLADRNFSTMNVMTPKLSVQTQFESPKSIEMDELRRSASLMVDTVSQNFGIDHCFSSYSTIHEDCKYLTAIIDQSVCNGLNLAPILMETEPIVDQMEIPVRKLPFAKRVNVIVTSVSSPSDFHFRCLSDAGIMSSLKKSLSTAPFNYSPDSTRAGHYYAAKFSDGRWYRLQVKDVIGIMVDVYRCDVGDTQRIQTTKLCQLTSDFFQWPQLAIPAKLAGIIPVNGDWSDKATEYFRKLTLYVELLAKFTNAPDPNGVTYPIEVTLIEGQLRVRIDDIMTELRLAKKA